MTLKIRKLMNKLIGQLSIAIQLLTIMAKEQIRAVPKKTVNKAVNQCLQQIKLIKRLTKK